MRCRFCGSNTVPPEIASDDTGTRSELQSGALPGELKRLIPWWADRICSTSSKAYSVATSFHRA
jgi:hypothetical protein